MTLPSGLVSWKKPRQSAKGAKKSESEILLAICASIADQPLLLLPSPGFRGFAL